jgi:hypothetical protein
MNFGREEDLISIDVADAADHLLIEQYFLNILYFFGG